MPERVAKGADRAALSPYGAIVAPHWEGGYGHRTFGKLRQCEGRAS